MTRRLSLRTRRKISRSRKGQSWPCSESAKKKISAANRGKVLSSSTRRKISKALKGKPSYLRTAESKKKTAAVWLGRKHTEAAKEKMRRSAVLRMERNKGPWINTKPELEVEGILKSNLILYRHPFRAEGYLVDFYIPRSNTIIEVDGCYWHGCPVHYPKRRSFSGAADRNKDRIWRKAGYSVVRVWEHDTYAVVRKLR